MITVLTINGYHWTGLQFEISTQMITWAGWGHDILIFVKNYQLIPFRGLIFLECAGINK